MAIQQLLTPEELQALLETLQSQEPELRRRDYSDDVQSYTLVSPENSVSPIMPALETIYERFAHRLQIELFEMLRTEVVVTPESPNLLNCTDFITGLGTPSGINLFSMRPLEGPSLLVLERDLIFYIVDTFFGGRCKRFSEGGQQDFSPVELRLLQRLRKVVWTTLETAWQGFSEIECELINTETRPRFITDLNPSDSLLRFNAQVSFAGISGQLIIAVPIAAFEPVRAQLMAVLNKEHASADPQLSRMLRDGIVESEVELCCMLAKAEISVRELLHLEVGDIITVDVPRYVKLQSEGIDLFSGTCGVMRGWRAMQVERILVPLDEMIAEEKSLS